MNASRLIAAVVSVVLALSAAAAVQAHGPDPVLSGESLYAQNKPLNFRWISPAPPSRIQSAILAAAVDANRSRLAKGPIFNFDAGGASFIQYGGPVVCGVNGLACMRRDEPTSFRMYFREQGHVFDWGTMKWCQMYTTWPTGCYDVENIALDEFGHVHILGHHVNFADDHDYTDAVVQTFARAKPAVGWQVHAFGRCDVATLQREYGLLAASTPVSTCIDVATTTTLVPSTTWDWSGEWVQFTATLRITDLDAYERLGGQGLSGRVVRLERRPTGGSWALVRTMSESGVAGTYVASAAISSVAEYRAVFVKPSTEGVRASTSPSIVITASPCTTICPRFPSPALAR
jgi:hypothetical protein